jgi:hypothetical protein
MRQWLKDFGPDDVRTVVLTCGLALTFVTLLSIWYHFSSGDECGIDCPSDFSAASPNSSKPDNRGQRVENGPAR